MPITNIEDYQLALEAQSDPEVPPEAKAKLRSSMEAFQRAQSGEVDLSALQAERGDTELPSFDQQPKPDKAFQFDVPPPRGPRVGAVGLPSHMGGNVEQFVDPSFNEFVRQNSVALGSLPEDVRAQVIELGTNAPEYQNWAQQQWEIVADEAERQGRQVERLPADNFKTLEPDAGLGASLASTSGKLLDTGLAFTGGAADSGALAVPGAGTALSALGGPETASQWRQRQERHPIAATAGAALGSVTPQNIVGLAARGGYHALARVGGYIAPKLEGLPGVAARTLGSGVVGGGTAVAEGAARDAVNQAVFDEAPAPGAAQRRFFEGTAGSAALNLVGEGARAVHEATRAAHPEIAGAETGGVRPGVTGLKATATSPARSLEAQRLAQGDETLLNVASKNAAPRIADAASAQNSAMLEQSAAETAAIHEKLSKAGNAPRVPTIADTGDFVGSHPNAADVDTFLNRDRVVVSRLQKGLPSGVGQAREAEALAAANGTQKALLDAADAGFYQRGTVYREARVTPDELSRLTAGGDFANQEIWSTAMSLDGAAGRSMSRSPGKVPVVFEITDHPVPTDGIPGSNTFDEALIPAGTRFKVSGQRTEGGHTIVSLTATKSVRPGRGAGQTLPPGPGDAEAEAFGRIAREQGENQASMLGLRQVATGGAPRRPPTEAGTGGPMRVSTGPVAEEVINILERHTGPSGAELPFFNDNDLRREMPKLFRVEVLPIEEAAQRAASEGGWVQPLDRLVSTGIIPGAVPASAGKVGYLRPTELDSRQFDELVQQLQTKAKLDTNLQPDPRYGQLAAAATKARGEFPGLNELNTKQSQRFDEYRERAEGAALRVGKNKEIPNYSQTPHNDKAALLNALDQYKAAGRSTGGQARDQHFDAIAAAADKETRDALRAIPMARSVDELRNSMQLSSPVAVGGKQRLIGSALVRLNPTIGALGSVPDIRALGEKLNPQLRMLLRQMRLKPVRSRVGMAALSGQIGLRGGVAGARAEQAADEYRDDDQVTREDLENLLRLKRATQKAAQ